MLSTLLSTHRSEALLVTTSWGLLGPETLASERRTRTLGLGAAVRLFNDRAVPGLGGVWFGKQLFLAVLGVAVAERVRASGGRVRNIEVTNAIEALACWLALDANGWKRDPRLRGATKMHGKTDLSFAAVRGPKFYVTTPMRQATVQPVRALGFVEGRGERFNAFGCTSIGDAFIIEACDDYRPYKRSVTDHLVSWVQGESGKVKSPELRSALSPVEPLSLGAREYLRERIIQGTGNASRRRQALAWVEQLRQEPVQHVSWETRPELLEVEHWRDLHAGALFFAARDSAIVLLDRIEGHVANQAELKMSLDAPLPGTVIDAIQLLRAGARTFLDNKHDPSPDASATSFCRECTEDSEVRLIEKLLAREGRVLRQREREIVPGVAFRGRPVDQPESGRSPEEVGAEAEVSSEPTLPGYVSTRVRNLFLLNVDLRNELNGRLGEPAPNGTES